MMKLVLMLSLLMGLAISGCTSVRSYSNYKAYVKSVNPQLKDAELVLDKRRTQQLKKKNVVVFKTEVMMNRNMTGGVEHEVMYIYCPIDAKGELVRDAIEYRKGEWVRNWSPNFEKNTSPNPYW